MCLRILGSVPTYHIRNQYSIAQYQYFASMNYMCILFNVVLEGWVYFNHSMPRKHEYFIFQL